MLSSLHALILFLPCFLTHVELKTVHDLTILRHSKVFMYFHKSLHYLFIVLSYIGFSFSSTLLVWGSILVYYVLLVIRETKYLLFLCCFGTIFKLPFFFFFCLTTSLPPLESLLYVRPSAGRELGMISSGDGQK